MILRRKPNTPPWRGFVWIGISLAVHATALVCCAYLVPTVTSRPPTQPDRESMHPQTSTGVLGEGFDWSRIPALQERPKLQVWKIEPITLPAPTQLPALARQEAKLHPPTPPPSAKAFSIEALTAKKMPAVSKPGPLKPAPTEQTSLVKVSSPKPAQLEPKKVATPPVEIVSTKPKPVPSPRAVPPEQKKAAKVQLVSSGSIPMPNAKHSDSESTAAKATPPSARSDVENLNADKPSEGNVGWRPTAGESRNGGGIGVPRLIYNPPPDYPPAALAVGFTGRVLLRVMVRADGTVQSAKLFRSSGVDMLDEAALKVIDSWRFVPMDLPGEVWEVVVPIKFAIEEQ